MNEKEQKDEIRNIIKKHMEAIGDRFDDYLCYQKYGEERFLSEGFRPTEEDFKERERIAAEQLDAARIEIRKLGEEVKSILKEIAEKDSNPDVRDWQVNYFELIFFFILKSVISFNPSIIMLEWESSSNSIGAFSSCRNNCSGYSNSS